MEPATTLTTFFQLCASDEFARTLLYSDVTHYYTWTAQKTWQRRKQGTAVDGHPGLFYAETMGRLYTVHPNMVECYYLRLLLVNVVGPRSFEDLRTVNGHLCATYHEACEHLGLLEDDAHCLSINLSYHRLQRRAYSACFPRYSTTVQ